MDLTFLNRIATSNASTNCRNVLRDFVLKHPDSLPELIQFGTDLTNKNHYKAVWILELLAEHNAEILIPFIDQICKTISQYKHESAIRGMSRVAFFLSTSKVVSLTEIQKEKMIEICLDWLIGDAKVAPKAYAMHTLAYYAKDRDWLKEELQSIVHKDFHSQSAGYKATAKTVLKQISRE
jgi:hypothetical protein